ncbi:uncharacterized protein L969DRAFT_130373 [Mixia osmundae IAM 14324]|uniref:Mid2 domain-containing protein n=1 Tax=Mixia osmundae (strain CBS 9802 / IAM 14324 / JCM 22182 / KY 12970) TaxID=764103 RepID=G7DZX2_MIXOS|nr:uncharacterized protein L969DRAFT_130373 [Mixia osmundae IAM 14324]KEI42124.1 hypothetical protein L969DRAFT_130373 [Mixia osmundae IAM 14324]GAA96132.1 hypothetical protein E5Q_02793 [Mixia osmundae IAM 14324]
MFTRIVVIALAASHVALCFASSLDGTRADSNLQRRVHGDEHDLIRQRARQRRHRVNAFGRALAKQRRSDPLQQDKRSQPEMIKLQKRQGFPDIAGILGGGGGATTTATAQPTSTGSSASPTSTSSHGGFFGGIDSALSSFFADSTTSTASQTVPASSSSSSSSTSSLPTTSSSVSSSSVTTSTTSLVTSSSSSSRLTRTSTSTLASSTTSNSLSIISSSASATATSSPDSSSSSSHAGVGKKAIIIIASIAGSIALIYIIWTIIRKLKFKPSKRFEDRYNSVDFGPSNTIDHRSDSDHSQDLDEKLAYGAGAIPSSRSFNNHSHGGSMGSLQAPTGLRQQHSPREELNDILPSLPPTDLSSQAGTIKRKSPPSFNDNVNMSALGRTNSGRSLMSQTPSMARNDNYMTGAPLALPGSQDHYQRASYQPQDAYYQQQPSAEQYYQSTHYAQPYASYGQPQTHAQGQAYPNSQIQGQAYPQQQQRQDLPDIYGGYN